MADRFSFYRSYYEAAKMLPEEEQGAFLMAVAEYAFDGVEPDFDGMEAMAFILIKPNIDASVKATENGKGGGRPPKKAKRDKKQGCEPSEKPPLKPTDETNSETTLDTDKDKERDMDKELEWGKGEEQAPFSEAESFDAGFAWQCLAELNGALGTMYSTMPAKCSHMLSRFEGRYSPPDVRRMVEFKRDEWRGTRFERHLTPNTLFGPDHFEQYMEQSSKEAGKDARFDKYR